MVATIKTGVKKLMRRALHVYLMAAVIAATVFVLLLDVYRVYRSDISIIVVSKNESAAVQHAEIVQSIAQMPKMLSFYNRLLEENRDVTDPKKGAQADARKKFWNNNVAVSTNDSIITLSVFGRSSQDAQKLSEKAAKTLFAFSGRWYDMRDGVQLSVIEEPQVSALVRNVPWIVIVSIFMGILIAVVVDALLSTMETTLQRAHRRSAMLRGQIRALRNALKDGSAPKIQNIEEIYTTQNEQNIQHRRPVIEDLLKRTSADMYPNFPEMPKNHPQPQASAPSNLPVADDSTFHGQPIHQEENQTPEEVRENLEEMRDSEPSKEELKRRLNQLLRGEK